MNNIPHNKILWTDEEVLFLKMNYEKYTNKELSKLLNKTVKNISRQLKLNNLYKSKESIGKLKSRINKSNGTDLNYKYVSERALLYETRGDFCQFDKYAYNKAIKMGWMDSVCSHMKNVSFSTPQLLLKHYLEEILKCECSYNNRTEIKPYEIDCYFPKYKIGWEYNGRRFHKDEEKDLQKIKKCKEKNITLLIIDEKNNDYRNYELNIKNQLIKQIDVINRISHLQITSENILNIDNKIIYPNILSTKETNIVYGKKLSEIKTLSDDLYKRIIKYRLFEIEKYNIINDKRKNNRYSSYEEYLNYLKNKKYKSFSELLKYEHPYRVLKRFNIEINKLKKELFYV